VKRFVLGVALCACSNKADGPHAKGSFVFTERVAADVFIATEAEVMKSEPLLRRIREVAREELARGAIAVERRAGTMILDVTVRDKDPRRAAMLCNHLMQTYVEYRMTAGITVIHQQMEAVSRELERTPNSPELARQMSELEVKRTTHQLDVRVLEPCLATTK